MSQANALTARFSDSASPPTDMSWVTRASAVLAASTFAAKTLECFSNMDSARAASAKEFCVSRCHGNIWGG